MTRVIMILFEQAVALDVTGPAEVFAGARDNGRPHYEVQFAATSGGERRTSSALRVITHDLLRIRPLRDDTVIVAGGSESAIRAAVDDAALLRWVSRASRVVRRIASVCSGAFVLASAGVLNGKRATTHWQGCPQLVELFPLVSVDSDAIFVRDGTVWTSAGVTTGIDMALAMVELDLGRAVADGLAADLVLYLRRPGFQAQFSTALVTQSASSEALGAALSWLRRHLERADVELFAKRAGLSVRTLHRRLPATSPNAAMAFVPTPKPAMTGIPPTPMAATVAAGSKRATFARPKTRCV